MMSGRQRIEPAGSAFPETSESFMRPTSRLEARAQGAGHSVSTPLQDPPYLSHGRRDGWREPRIHGWAQQGHGTEAFFKDYASWIHGKQGDSEIAKIEGKPGGNIPELLPKQNSHS